MKVLDKGSVELIDHMGSDLDVVDAARVSFSKESEWESAFFVTPEQAKSWGKIDYGVSDPDPCSAGYYAERLSPKDTKLINFLARGCSSKDIEALVGELSGSTDDELIKKILLDFRETGRHWTPFGQVNVKLRIKMPIFVARQAMRTNVGVVWNEESRRYIDSEPEFYEPEVWRGRPEGSIKQGSGGAIDVSLLDDWGGMDFGIGNINDCCLRQYEDLLESGVAPEMARLVLPQSTYTTVIANFTLAAAARFVGLRSDSHAQKEIQEYANAMSELIAPRFPVSWAALTGGE